MIILCLSKVKTIYSINMPMVFFSSATVTLPVDTVSKLFKKVEKLEEHVKDLERKTEKSEEDKYIERYFKDVESYGDSIWKDDRDDLAGI